MTMEQQMGSLEDEKVRIRKQMQIELATRHGEDMVDFIDTRGKQFGDYVDSHQEVLSKFKEDPEEALKEMEDVVYH